MPYRPVRCRKDVYKRQDLTVLTPLPEGDAEITRGYVSDLLSDVLGKATEGALWVTLQSHPNVIACLLYTSRHNE